MYNEKQKNIYIETKKTIGFKKNIMNIFARCELLENKYCKDCSEFTFHEIKELYISLGSTSLSGLYNYNNHLARYTNWCISEKLTKIKRNQYTKIDKNTLCCFIDEEAKNKRIMSREQLLNEIKKIPNVCDQFLSLAIFEGLGERNDFTGDFCDLDLSNFGENCVHLKNRTLTISNELVELALKSANEYDKYDSEGYVMSRGFKNNDMRIIKDSQNTAHDDKEHRARNVASRLIRLVENYGEAFRYGSLRDSGEIELLKSFVREDKNETGDIYEVYMNHKEEYDIRFGKPQPDQFKDEMYLRYADMINV